MKILPVSSHLSSNGTAIMHRGSSAAICLATLLVGLTVVSSVFAQGYSEARPPQEPNAAIADPSEVFLKAFTSVQQGEKLETEGKLRPALAKYRFAASLLDQLTQTNPNWQPLIVRYRVRKTSDNIHQLESKIAASGASKPGSPTSAGVGGDDSDLPVPDEAPSPAGGSVNDVSSAPRILPATPVNPSARTYIDRSTSDLTAKLNDTQNQLRAALKALASAQKDKEQAVRQKDDVEFLLHQAQSGVRAAQKRLERTRADRDQLQAEVKDKEAKLNDALAKNPGATETRKELRDQLAAQKKLLAKAEEDAKAAKKESEAFAARVKESEERTASLTKERDTLAARTELTQDAEKKIQTLQVENDALTKKLSSAEQSIADLTAESVKRKGELEGMQKELIAARDQLAQSRDEKDRSDTAITEMREQLDQNAKQIAEMKTKGQTSEDFERLNKENALFRDLVMRQLKDQVRREQARKLVTDELDRLAVQSNVLTQQVAELGRPSVQLTDEERALFKEPLANLAESPDAVVANLTVVKPKSGAESSAAETPAATVATMDQPAAAPAAASSGVPATGGPSVETKFQPKVADENKQAAKEAKEFFDRGRYVEAEKAYQKLIAREPQNPYLLSNQGVVLFREGKLKNAEGVLKKSINAAPNDAFTQATLGIVYYRMGQYDNALSCLTQAIQLDPKNATAHAYLGITSSQKGWPEAGLEELQKAIALNPNYADAHFNIAVIYATNQPPSKDQAMEHYKTAISLGASPDPGLEKLIDQKNVR